MRVVIDRQVEKLQAEVATIFECPELQECRVCFGIFWLLDEL